MFKSVIFLFCGLVAGGSCVTFIDKSFQDGKSILLGISLALKCTSYFSCLDCKTARICKPDGLGKFQQVTTIPCPTDKPYCNEVSGTCSATPDVKCGAADATFICMGDGYFPDANCTNYHICTEFKAFKYHCAVKGENYDAEQRKCRAEAPCGTFDCKASGQKVFHDYYPQYYGYCRGAVLLPTVIDR
uniref:Putative chitin binding peritrophin-a domain protein n=1 Tax=Panstrongylus lignarius TaxID=156445 RepID=A0A224XLG9_9HEMI